MGNYELRRSVLGTRLLCETPVLYFYTKIALKHQKQFINKIYPGFKRFKSNTKAVKPETSMFVRPMQAYHLVLF
jgi:hypothetical protein